MLVRTLFASMLLVSTAVAADVTVVGNTVVLNGAIERGDAVKIAPLLAENATLKLTSNGGSFFEAVEIAKLVFASNASTVASAQCDFECAYVWLAGSTKYIDPLAPTAPVIAPPNAEGAIGSDLPTMAMVGWLISQYDLPVGVSYRFGFLGQGSTKSLTLTAEFMVSEFKMPVSDWVE